MAEQKYVRINDDNFIIFPNYLEHSTFKDLKPVSAGFCQILHDSVECYGESYSLKIKSKEDDSILAVKQIFGINAMLNLLKN